jgi:hypothetical protein
MRCNYINASLRAARHLATPLYLYFINKKVVSGRGGVNKELVEEIDCGIVLESSIDIRVTAYNAVRSAILCV